MIQDILPRKLYNTFVRKEPSPDSRILSFREGGALYREQDGELTFLTFRQVKEYYKKKEQELPKAVFLFSVINIADGVPIKWYTMKTFG